MPDLPGGAKEVNLKELDQPIPHPVSLLNLQSLRFALGLRGDGAALCGIYDNAVLRRTLCWGPGTVCPMFGCRLVV